MADKTLNTRQKQKYDTSTNWATNNIVLLAGEIGFESDTNKFKVGNGVNNWKELPYAGNKEIMVDSTLSNTSTNPVQNKIINEALKGKVSVEQGKGLSTNDYTTADKNKLAGVEDGANKIVEYLVNAVVSGETLTITKQDGSTVTFKGGGGVPPNMVTTDTEQTISGAKTFTGTVLVPNVILP